MLTPLARRVVAVSLGLSLAGAFIGAACGALALLPIAIHRFVYPHPDDNFFALSEFLPYAAMEGMLVGAFMAPLVAWTILRRVALKRGAFWSTIGALVGIAAGWLLYSNPWAAIPIAIPIGGVVGLLGASYSLRRSMNREYLRAATLPMRPMTPDGRRDPKLQ